MISVALKRQRAPPIMAVLCGFILQQFLYITNAFPSELQVH